MSILRTILLSAVVLVLMLMIVALVVLPAIIAFRRGHPHRWFITVLTVLGFWTGIVWLGALIWPLLPFGRKDDDVDDLPDVPAMTEPVTPIGVVATRRRLGGKPLAGIAALFVTAAAICAYGVRDLVQAPETRTARTGGDVAPDAGGERQAVTARKEVPVAADRNGEVPDARSAPPAPQPFPTEDVADGTLVRNPFR